MRHYMFNHYILTSALYLQDAITYRMQGDAVDDEYFTMDPSTGIIMVIRALDIPGTPAVFSVRFLCVSLDLSLI